MFPLPIGEGYWLRVNTRHITGCGGLSEALRTPAPDGFPEGSRHSHIDGSALANKCPLHGKEHSSGRASHVFGNPSGSGLLKIPNDRRQKARRPGILAPDNPPPNNVFKKCAEPCSAQSRVWRHTLREPALQNSA